MRRIQPALCHLGAARGPSTPSFDHLVGKAEQPQRHDEFQALKGAPSRPVRPSRAAIDSLHAADESVFGRRLHRKVARLRTLEDSIDVSCCLSVLALHTDVRAVVHEAAVFGEMAIDGR
jgi:hypothetical protein